MEGRAISAMNYKFCFTAHILFNCRLKDVSSVFLLVFIFFYFIERFFYFVNSLFKEKCKDVNTGEYENI